MLVSEPPYNLFPSDNGRGAQGLKQAGSTAGSPTIERSRYPVPAGRTPYILPSSMQLEPTVPSNVRVEATTASSSSKNSAGSDATTKNPGPTGLPEDLPIRSKLVVKARDDENLPNNDELESAIRRRHNESRQFSSAVPSSGPMTCEGLVCSTKGSVVGAMLTAILLQIGLVAAFWLFYTSKQRHWSKLVNDYDPRTIHSTTSSSSASFPSSPEVIFRSVYDRLSAGGRRILIPYPNSSNNSSTTHSRDK